MVQEQHEFLAQLRNSKPAVDRVARWYENQGWEVFVPVIVESPSAAENHKFRDNGDIWIEKENDGPWRVEVKESKHGYENLYVDETRNFDNKDPRPDFYILLDSRPDSRTKALKVDVIGTYKMWEILHHRWDSRKRDFRDYYSCPTNLMEEVEIPL